MQAVQPRRTRRTTLIAACIVATVGFMATGPALAGAAGSRGYTIKRKNGAASDLITVSRVGYALYQIDARGKRISGLLVDYRTRKVTLLDYAHHRFQTLGLAVVVSRAVRERALLKQLDTPYFTLPDNAVLPRERLTHLRGTKRIKGLRARAYLLKRKGQPDTRLWYSAALPKPPAAVAAVLAKLAAGGGRSLVGNVVLRAEQRVGKRYRVATSATRVRAVRVGSRAFRPPAKFKKSTQLVRPIAAKPRSVPATVAQQVPYLPIQDRPEIFAVYEGARFASEPETVRRLDAALSGTILQHPYIDGMEQYGVGPGRLIGHWILPVDPPREAGQTTFQGWGDNVGVANQARLHGAPYAWSRIGPDPLIVIFMPMEAVDLANNNGYHSVMPTETSLLDPLGLLLLPVYPFAIVKVPRFSPSFSHIDGATETASHETAETASDPVAGFTDPSKARLSPPQGVEIGDICQEGVIAPWSRRTRVNGISVATYWSQNTASCFPDPRPTVRIVTPPHSVIIHRGESAALSATASDPFGGPVTLAWSSNRQGALGTGSPLSAILQVGNHLVTVTATNGDGATRSASVIVKVVSRPPVVTISSPVVAVTYPSDQDISFHGEAVDPADGPLSGASLQWFVDGLPVGSGGSIVHRITTEGVHTVTLTATNLVGGPASASVSVSVGLPTGAPSVLIDSPAEGQNLPTGETVAVSFTGHASDPEDGTLSGGSLQWFDDYTDAGGIPHHDSLGSGISITHTLYSGGVPRPHTITLVATDSNAHSTTDTIHVTSGTFG